MNHTVTINSPQDNEQHTWTTLVQGRMMCSRSDDKERLQAMVHAADDMWYPQPQIRYEPWGYFWVPVKLGFKTDPHEHYYTIAVGVGGEKITSPVKQLPEDVLWTTVSVERI